MTDDQLTSRKARLDRTLTTLSEKQHTHPDPKEVRRLRRVTEAALTEVERELRQRQEVPPHKVHGMRQVAARTGA